MGATRGLRPAAVVLAEVCALLDGVEPERGWLTDAERLGLVGVARRAAGRLQALVCVLVGEAAVVSAADREVGVPLVSWLGATGVLTRREALRLVGQGRDLVGFPRVVAAALAGRVGVEQAHAIAGVLKQLPADFSTVQVGEAEDRLLAHVHDLDSGGLKRLARGLVEVLDPVGCEEREARRLERDLRAARAARHLRFCPDGQGSVVIRGSLPTVDAEPLMRVVDAYAQAERRAAVDRLDPVAEVVTPAMRRVDGLCALVAAHQRGALAPAGGGDRPRVVVTLDFDRLREGCVRAGLVSGEPITAGELRLLACDAEVLPVVLGGGSQPLDVGRSQRLVTPALRTALALRDGGCVFPGCDVSGVVCHAHHLVPWWAGGPTALSNLVLVCPHHHNLVEPARDGPPGGRWEVVVGGDGVPEVRPPTRVDPARRPLRHQRFLLASLRE